MTRPQKLFTGIPGAGYVGTKAYMAHLAMFGATSRFWERTFGRKGQTVLMVTDRMAVAKARNTIAKKALEEGADWIFWLDDDMRPPPDVVERLMVHDAPLASGLCSKRILPPEVMAYTFFDGGFHAFVKNEWPPTFQCDGVGMACVLMKREVLQHVWDETNGNPFQYANGRYGTEDMYFFELASKAGFKTTVDATFKVGHLGIHEYTPGEDQKAALSVA